MTECVFCQIVAGDVPSTVIAESDHAIAFRDIAPHAPVHVLVVPRQHVDSADELDEQSAFLVGELVLLAQRVAEHEGVRTSGYRLIMNVGPDALMSVPHLHLHVVGGQRLAGSLG
jgi:histidine triad (HIT) family protein